MRPRPFSIIVAALLSIFASDVLICAHPATAYTPAEAKAPMTITLVRSDATDCGSNCPEWLALTGQIVPKTPALLLAVLARLGQRKIPVLVDSPGGAVEAAMMMGKMIRDHHLDVGVVGTALSHCAVADSACGLRLRAGEQPGFVAGGYAACASACVLVLAAGTNRLIAQDSYVGVHQMITRRTLNRVMNTFRVVRRMVGGRVAEVSRTLVASRTVSSRIVQEGASDNTYSDVDRYLLAMGVRESIMPIMRETPFTGIHWMTPIELAMTRIATDGADARTLVARAVTSGVVPPVPPLKGAPASLTFSTKAELGAVTWQVDRNPVSTPETLELAAAIDFPGRHLRGALLISRNIDPHDAATFVVAVRLALLNAGAEAATTLGAPKICDAETCTTTPPLNGAFQTQAAAGYVFRVEAGDGDRFMASLRHRNWLTFPVEFRGRTAGELGLALYGDARAAVLDWQRRCCGVAGRAVGHASYEEPPKRMSKGVTVEVPLRR